MLHHVLFLTHGNQHSQHSKNYKTEKLRNNMEGDKEKKSIDTQCESILILVLKSLFHQKIELDR